MDGRRFIEYVFKRQKSDPITQVVMNLPHDAVEFLGMHFAFLLFAALYIRFNFFLDL